MTMREAVAVTLAGGAFALVAGILYSVARAFANPVTASPMWLVTGIVIGVGGAALILAANALQDALRLALHDRAARTMPRVVDVAMMGGPALPPNASPYDNARTRKALADAALTEERARAEAERRAAPDFGPGEWVSNGFSGVPWEKTERLWPSAGE